MNRYIKIGLLVTLSSIAGVVFMMRTADKISGGDTYRVSAYLTDATGLLPDSKVRMYGVVVGSVRAITLDDGMARVDLELADKTVLYEDAIFEKRMESLLGTASVNIQPGSPVRRQLGNGAVIQSVQSGTALEQTLSTLRDISASGDSMLDEVEKIFTDEYDPGGAERGGSAAVQTLYEVRNTLETLNLILEDMRGITSAVNARSDEELQRFSALMAQMTRLTQNMNTVLVQNEEKIARSFDQLERSMELVSSQLEASEAILSEVKEIAATVNSGKGSLGKLVHDETLYDRVVSITKEAEEAIQSTIGIDLEVEYRGDYLINMGEMRNQVGLRLIPGAKEKYYAVGIVDKPGAGQSTTTTTTTQTGGATTVETTEEMVSGWVPYIQLAYEFGPMTVRGGLIDGKGGMGLDYSPLSLASVSLEAYDFDSIAEPNLRAYGSVRPFYGLDPKNPASWLYFSGGVDDILGKRQIDYFLGVGLTFQDNDLKGAASFMSIRP
ncbi:MAG: MCE family protein [Spirochaetales bacterium]|nr:MCE family protein [Spirochaetales bacterium]